MQVQLYKPFVKQSSRNFERMWETSCSFKRIYIPDHVGPYIMFHSEGIGR